jgi:hypothetical protein
LSYKRLHLFVEGPDDSRFFKSVKINNLFKVVCNYVNIYEYSEKPDKNVNGYLKTIYQMNEPFIFSADFNSNPCVSQKKESLLESYIRLNDENRICLVVIEIESWYLAGLDDDACRKHKIRKRKFTDDITKEKFDSLIPRAYDSRNDFMIEILKDFSIETAKQKNKSFKYFCEKFIEA